MSLDTIDNACEETRAQLLERRRGHLDAAARAAVDAHLATCAACRAEDDADAQLEQRLRGELPAWRAPAPLLARLAGGSDVAPLAVGPPSPAPRVRPRRWLRTLAPALAVAAALLVAIPGFYERHVVPARLARVALDHLGGEAVNDHLRVLDGEQPLAIVSSGIHEVKPWFAGKLDFAPAVAFAGDAEFPLQGGLVTTFLDRKAAALAYHCRLHAITLFVLRADALTWPAPPVTARTVRGFHVFLWRDGELGYALVSDLDAGELGTLAARLGAPLR
jgi:anti-sigma factor RsiW